MSVEYPIAKRPIALLETSAVRSVVPISWLAALVNQLGGPISELAAPMNQLGGLALQLAASAAKVVFPAIWFLFTAVQSDRFGIGSIAQAKGVSWIL